ncbi:hypothetical protein LVD17_19015 [Fulvivirga ulvae]|uniref:hypothetical protein n=1 Tax=Fulvivirga ulvae TaxID=2904245 RepID=UPI001F48E6AE|nr:hypothetical protein [Fulvivirga ulvae]UII30385.1 hypothetical protein LVD17_19015 [Fulvivirga ulvae]
MKTMKGSSILFICFLVFLCTSCWKSSDKPMDWGDYQTWLEDNEKSLKKEKEVNGLEITLAYLPSELLTYQHLQTDGAAFSQQDYDSIYSKYRCGLTFDLVLQAPKNDPNYSNLIYYNISSQEEYTSRVYYLNFQASDILTLEVNDQLYIPVLTQFTGYQELGNELRIRMVFSPDVYHCGDWKIDWRELQVVFKDPFWDVGTNRFSFDKHIISDKPKLII